MNTIAKNVPVASSIEYAGHTLDISSIHPASLHALLRRGMTHYLGNEQSSKVVAWAKAEAEASLKAHKASDPDSTRTLADFEPDDDAKQARKVALQAEAVAAIRAGTVGFRAVGPSIDPLEVAIDKIAKTQVLAVLAANGIKRPKGDEAVTFPDGSSKTLDDMIATRRAHPKFKDAIEAEAKKALQAAEKARKRALAEAEALKGDLADMGL